MGSVYLASGGQPLRAGLRVDRIEGGWFNFTETQPHYGKVTGVGTVTDHGNGTATVSIPAGPGTQAHTGMADAWPGLAPGLGCTRIVWDGGRNTWGKQTEIPETRFQVASQMFGVSTIRPLGGGPTIYLYTGERYQTGLDGLFAHGFMYWQPLSFDGEGVVQPIHWVDNFTLPL